MLPLPALQPPSLAPSSRQHWCSWGQEISLASTELDFAGLVFVQSALRYTVWLVLHYLVITPQGRHNTFYKEICFSDISAKCENKHTFRIRTELLLPEIKEYTILYLGYLSKICWHSLHLPFYAFGFSREIKFTIYRNITATLLALVLLSFFCNTILPCHFSKLETTTVKPFVNLSPRIRTLSF